MHRSSCKSKAFWLLSDPHSGCPGGHLEMAISKSGQRFRIALTTLASHVAAARQVILQTLLSNNLPEMGGVDGILISRLHTTWNALHGPPREFSRKSVTAFRTPEG